MSAAFGTLKNEASVSLPEKGLKERWRRSVQKGPDPRAIERSGLGGATPGDERDWRRSLEDDLKLSGAELRRGKAKESNAPRATGEAGATFLEERSSACWTEQ